MPRVEYVFIYISCFESYYISTLCLSVCNYKFIFTRRYWCICNYSNLYLLWGFCVKNWIDVKNPVAQYVSWIGYYLFFYLIHSNKLCLKVIDLHVYFCIDYLFYNQYYSDYNQYTQIRATIYKCYLVGTIEKLFFEMFNYISKSKEKYRQIK